MRILVTGGGGFAGRHLLRHLLADERNKVTATALHPVPKHTSEDPLSVVRWLPMDLTSCESVQEVVQLARPDRIYHLAGQASVGRSFATPLDTWDVNATGTLRLLHALEQLPDSSRFLLVSSAEVYGAAVERREPLKEDSALRPLNPYGSSKAAAEMAALAVGAAGKVDVVVARSFSHIGPGQDARFVFPSIAVQLARIQEGSADARVRVGNVEVRRDFLDVRDIITAYTTLMERGARSSVYNVASGTAHSLRSLIERLIELSGVKAQLEVDSGRLRPTDIPHQAGDATRLRKLGWSPRHTLDDALLALLEDARASG